MGTITKALEMLDFFSRDRREMGLGDFVRLTGRDKATVHRHLVELTENGFLEQHPVTRAYRLGPAILRLSAVREATHPLRALMRPVVTELAEAAGELAHGSILQGEKLSPVFHADPRRHGTQVHFDEAEMLPLHATSSGLSILAFAPPGFVARVLGRPLRAYTDQTVTEPARLQALIAEARATGVAALGQTFDREVASQGVALFDAEGQPIGAVSVSVPMVRASAGKQAEIRPHLIRAALALTRSLGGALPPSHPLCAPDNSRD